MTHLGRHTRLIGLSITWTIGFVLTAGGDAPPTLLDERLALADEQRSQPGFDPRTVLPNFPSNAIPDQYVVFMRASSSQASATATQLSRDLGIVATEPLKHVPAFAASIAPERLTTVLADPRVERIGPIVAVPGPGEGGVTRAEPVSGPNTSPTARGFSRESGVYTLLGPCAS
jgi:hypothetical protein